MEDFKVKVVKLENLDLGEVFKHFMSMLNEPYSDLTPHCYNEDSIDFFIARIAKKQGWKFEKTEGWIKSIWNFYPASAFNILAREVAIYMDEKYEDHIEESDKIFVISLLDGRIQEICKAHIKNYKNFAAFRSKEDAKIACSILRTFLKYMFSSSAK